MVKKNIGPVSVSFLRLVDIIKSFSRSTLSIATIFSVFILLFFNHGFATTIPVNLSQNGKAGGTKSKTRGRFSSSLVTSFVYSSDYMDILYHLYVF